MKQILTLLFILSFSFCFSQNFGKVVIESKSGIAFLMSINGVCPSDQPATKYVFNFLDETNYKVKIWFPGSAIAAVLNINNTLGYETVYELKKDQYGSFILDMESKISFTALPSTPPTPTINPVNPVPIQPACINDEDYKSMLSTLKKESFDDTRLDLAKSFIQNIGINAAQINGFIKTFSFEKNKIEFAKYAYNKCIDKQNYYKVYDSFSFSSSKKEVSDYIKKQ